MIKLFALIKKPTDVYELYSCIKHYKIKNVTIYIKQNKKDVNWKNSELNFHKYCKKKLIKIVKYLKIQKINENQIIKIDWLQKLKKYDFVALPFNTYKSFYKICGKLNNLGKKTILISDGIIDSFSPIQYILTTKIQSIFSIHKFILYFVYRIYQSNECFYTCYPLNTFYSNKTRAVKKDFLPDKNFIKLLKKFNVDNLILGGFREKVNLKKLLIKKKIKNYCYLIRGENNLIINGKSFKIKDIIIAEEILNTNLIKCVHSNLTTPMYFAKIKKIKVNLLLKKFKPFFLFYFMKKKFFSI